jgi:hypothetical protein
MIRLGDLASSEFQKLACPVSRCPTGKCCFPSKRVARQSMRGKAHTQMRAYRCEFGDHYHMGHRRGTHS